MEHRWGDRPQAAFGLQWLTPPVLVMRSPQDCCTVGGRLRLSGSAAAACGARCAPARAPLIPSRLKLKRMFHRGILMNQKKMPLSSWLSSAAPTSIKRCCGWRSCHSAILGLRCILSCWEIRTQSGWIPRCSEESGSEGSSVPEARVATFLEPSAGDLRDLVQQRPHALLLFSDCDNYIVGDLDFLHDLFSRKDTVAVFQPAVGRMPEAAITAWGFCLCCGLVVLHAERVMRTTLLQDWLEAVKASR